MLNCAKILELMKLKDIKSLHALSIQTKIPYTTIAYMFEGHDMHVSTLIELARFFNVPMDHLINKSFGIVTYSDVGSIYTPTSSIIEATVETMM